MYFKAQCMSCGRLASNKPGSVQTLLKKVKNLTFHVHYIYNRLDISAKRFGKKNIFEKK